MNQIKGLDRVILTFVLAIAVTAIADPEQVPSLLRFVGKNLTGTLPLLFVAASGSALMRATGADQFVGAAMHANPVPAVIMAVLAGALSPFCACAVIALIIGFLRAGVPVAAVLAFILTCPVTDPATMIMTAGILGSEFAVVKTLSAIGIGLLGGLAVITIDKVGFPTFDKPLREELRLFASAGGSPSVKPAEISWYFWREGERLGIFVKEFRKILWFTLKWLAIAWALQGLIANWLPMNLVARKLATLGWWALPASAFAGVPVYLNSYAVIPFAQALIEAGVNKGTVLSFALAANITCIPTILAIKAMVRTPVLLAYISVALAGATTAGFIYRLWTT
ncbi:MAG: permease [Hyphomicrobiales bacterium]